MGIRISGSKTFPTGEGGEPGENRGSPSPPSPLLPSLTPQLRHNRTIFSKTVPSIDSLGHGGVYYCPRGDMIIVGLGSAGRTLFTDSPGVFKA